jgi:hypothetical protein
MMKLQGLRKQLQPLLESSDRLRGEIGEDWFNHVEHVFGMRRRPQQVFRVKTRSMTFGRTS